jgi:hypothetical protein
MKDGIRSDVYVKSELCVLVYSHTGSCDVYKREAFHMANKSSILKPDAIVLTQRNRKN